MHSRGHFLVLCVLLGVAAAARDWRCPLKKSLDKIQGFPHPTSCQKYKVCAEDGSLVEKSCPPGEEFNRWKLRCDTPSKHGCRELVQSRDAHLPSCHNQADGRKFPTTNCNSFVVCHNGSPKLQSCDWGLLFNADLGVCDWAANVKCYEMSGPPVGPAPDCMYKDGVYLPNIYDCNSFYVCKNNVPMLQRCDAALVFDPALETCNWPAEVNCVPEPLPDVDPFLPVS